jgi:para-nitrobenzyl esterase
MNATQKPIVETFSGKIEGQFEDGLYVFKGIPYAEPPVGKLRWMPPEPRKSWRGIRQAHKFGAASLQIRTNYSDDLACKEVQSEDCLFLNIWTPKLDDARRPVMFWIHGGGFQSGAGSIPLYRGDTLAKHGNVVVVTINYRLGVLGFLNLYEVTHGKVPASGNQGLLDQILALEWVRENIARFGGDPGNITVFGESAGAMSASCMLGMDQARGLFQKAIPQSGGPNVVRPLGMVVKIAGQFLEILGLKGKDVEELKTLPARKLLAAQRELALKAGGVTPVEPLLDGRVIRERPMNKIWEGSASGVIVLGGANLDEPKMSLLQDPNLKNVDETLLKAKVEKLVSGESERLITIYRQARSKRGISTTPYDILAAIQADAMFRIPQIRVAEAQLKNKQKAYNYLFTWQSPYQGGILGACHTLELGFVFGHPSPHFCGSGPVVQKLSHSMQDAWTSFARTGDPSCESLGRWPEYGEKRNTMILGEKCHTEEAPLEEERAAWNDIGEISPATR